jgi:transcription antitermination protein NusB
VNNKDLEALGPGLNQPGSKRGPGSNPVAKNVAKTPSARSKARRFALQAHYQIQLSDCSVASVESQFLQDHDMKRVDTEYFHELLSGTSVHRQALIGLITPTLDRSFESLDPIEKAILFIGCFELVHRIDVPYRVVINEGIELARQFGASESHKYINSILDRLAKDHRASERGR